MAPVMECTVSKATILGTFLSTDFKSSSKCCGSLCLNMCLGTLLLRIPCIIEAWLPESEKMWQPGSACANVNNVESLAM